MFKRFLVMDLYDECPDKIKEWVENTEKTLPNTMHGIFKVRLANGDETKAYFCFDRCSFAKMKNPSFWWKKGTGEPLYNVTHWGVHDSSPNNS